MLTQPIYPIHTHTDSVFTQCRDFVEEIMTNVDSGSIVSQCKLPRACWKKKARSLCTLFVCVRNFDNVLYNFDTVHHCRSYRCFIDYFYVTPAYRFTRYETLNVYPSNWDIDRLVIFLKFTAQLWIPMLSVVHISKTKMAAMDFLWNLPCTRIVTSQSSDRMQYFFFFIAHWS